MREYGDRALQECEARIAYYQMLDDAVAAEEWKRIRDLVQQMSPPPKV